MSDISIRLRQERKRLGLSQREMGQIGGVAANAQGNYENGGRLPKADYLAAVANAGVDVLYVLTGRYVPDVATNDPQHDGAEHAPAMISALIEVRQAVLSLVNRLDELSISHDLDRELMDGR